MSKKSGKRRDRYDTSGNVEAEYVDAAHLVLKNKRGIIDLRELQFAEEEALVEAYHLLFREVRMQTPMTCDLILVIHPFRDGNARTIKLMSDLLAAQTGRPPLAYDQTEPGRDAYIEAAKTAFKWDYRPMAAIIRDAVDRSQNRP